MRKSNKLVGFWIALIGISFIVGVPYLGAGIAIIHFFYELCMFVKKKTESVKELAS